MHPELQQGLIRLIYWTWLHNAEAIALGFGLLLVSFLLVLKPKRQLVLFFLGFAFLLARFEYLKHVASSLEEQTVTTVIQEEGHYRARRWFDVFFNDLVPLGLYIGGWGSVFLGVLASAWGGRQSSKDGDQGKSKNKD